MDITDSVTASPGDNAEFFCMVDANPMTAETIKWTRDGFDMESRDDGIVSLCEILLLSQVQYDAI